MRTTIAALLALAAVGCGEEVPPADTGTGTDSEAGVVRVHSAAPRIADTLRPTLTTRYGRRDGPPEYLFSAVRRFAVDSEGRVFVHDMAGGIRAFSRDGEFESTVAVAGQGPSDVGYPISMAGGGPGRFAVLDRANRRVAIFDGSEAEFTARAPEGYLGYNEGSLVLDRAGEPWVRLPERFGDDRIAVGPRAYGRVTAGGIVDSVVVPERFFDTCPLRTQRGFQSGFWEDSRQPFDPTVRWTLASNGDLLAGCPASFEFERISPDGRRTIVTWERELVEVSDEELEFRRTMPVAKAGPRLPAYSALIPTDDGRTWVALVQPNEREALEPDAVAQFGIEHTWLIPDDVSLDVFDAEGGWLATVTLPASMSYSGYPTAGTIVIRGDSIWGVDVDELGVTTVAKYVVPSLPAASSAR